MKLFDDLQKFNVLDALQSFDKTIRSAEPKIVNLFNAASPWLTPIFPAVLTGWNVYALVLSALPNELRIPAAVVCALAVESINISGTSQVIQLWTRNRATDKGLLNLSFITSGHYLLTVISANVLIESAFAIAKFVGNEKTAVALGVDAAIILTKALLCTLSVTGAVNIAVRTRISEGKETEEQQKAERKAERIERKQERNATQPAPVAFHVVNANATQQRNATHAQQDAIPQQPKPRKGAETKAAIERLRAEYPNATASAIAKALGVATTTVTRQK